MTREEFDALVRNDLRRLAREGAEAYTAKRIKAADRGKVNIHHVYPPIPVRDFDYLATFENDEPDDNGHMLHGYGKTEAEALEELLTAWEDKYDLG